MAKERLELKVSSYATFRKVTTTTVYRWCDELEISHVLRDGVHFIILTEKESDEYEKLQN